ncbi:intermediate filament protein ON3-like isoform X1 [Nerophis ophidion]|uniref:intermediate filament protein ON3-like isoform X1 n=1 Tax=Nerophis ophidion TaxID=159077 RepID=UPI002ADF7996|nr:intermediate filament protein ON3-like isoform X1 [Nerophis ophidion]
MSKGRDYSSQSYTPGSAKSYPTNKVDSAGKSRERDDMVGLNDKFVKLIEKVKHQEDENRKLDAKLKILREQEAYQGRVEGVVKQLEEELKQQIDKLLYDRAKLEDELHRNQDVSENTKERYEEELLKKAELENDFIITKKDADEEHLEAVHLALDLEDLIGQLEFLRVGHDEEIKELESQIQNETVILRENSKRLLDMDEIVEGVKGQYANMAARTREEAEHWNRKKRHQWTMRPPAVAVKKATVILAPQLLSETLACSPQPSDFEMDVMGLKAGQREQEVREIRREISDVVRFIQRLNSELEALKRKEESLKKDISDATVEGEASLAKARGDIAQLEEALRRAKHDMAGQIREHQELMNLKLALDIEILTYRKLLEGEEMRMNELMRHSDF